MVKSALDEFGKVDILVNNAGGSPPEKGVPFCESEEEVWDWAIATNLKGVRNCARAVINHMIERKSGKIVSIASISGVTGTLTKVDYSAAKAGVIGFTKALAKEVAPYGINVNCVSPGPIETPLFLSNTKELQEAAIQAVFLKRAGKPEEIANMVVFLASDEASFIIGQNFIVDGGRIL
jgi:NAD(P)-dependent dehydrogenase (short-subunit alcohol dehydrogenase family)